jgi:hypothetical protein
VSLTEYSLLILKTAWEDFMLVFAAGSFVIGALLAHFFKFYSLFPVAVLAVLMILLNPFDAGWTIGTLCIRSAILVTMLQVGFIAGAVLQAYVPKSLLKRSFSRRRSADLAGMRPRRHF